MSGYYYRYCYLNRDSTRTIRKASKNRCDTLLNEWVPILINIIPEIAAFLSWLLIDRASHFPNLLSLFSFSLLVSDWLKMNTVKDKTEQMDGVNGFAYKYLGCVFAPSWSPLWVGVVIFIASPTHEMCTYVMRTLDSSRSVKLNEQIYCIWNHQLPWLHLMPGNDIHRKWPVPSISNIFPLCISFPIFWR